MGIAGSALATVLPGAASLGDGGKAEAATTGIALGSFTPSLPWSFHETDGFSEMVGQKQAIIHWFQDWEMSFDASYMNEAVSRGGTPLVTWEPWKFGGGVNQRGYALRKILNGKHDGYVRRWARAAAAWGKPFFLAFAHEMNGDWTSWSPGVNGNTASQFVAAWRRVHGIFQRQGATNVRWVWAPVAHYAGATPYRYVYPGGSYVNWVGMSGYNWGDTRAWSRWQSFSEIFGASYDNVRRMTRKPMMIREVGCAESGGDKESWVQSAYLKEVPSKFPRIKAIVWFHANKENDWRVDSSPGALEAYKRVAASLPYAGSVL
jgi:hypothetical protein